MIKLLKYDLNSEFESNKATLNKLDNYVVLTEDNQIVHLKPLNIFYVTTNNSGTIINKQTDSGIEQITLENGENKLTDWNHGFYFDYSGMKQDQITSFDFSKYDTSNFTTMSLMFSGCTNLTSLDLSNFDTSKVTNMSQMFSGCTNLTSLDLSNFDTSKVTDMQSMFSTCNSLTHIKCTQTFKDWCWTNQNTIDLPTAMRDGGNGQWEIIQ